MALGLRPESATLNDINPHLINFYNQIKWHNLSFEDLTFVNEKQAFLEARRRFNELIQYHGILLPEKAALFYYLNRTCFNGLCRFNSKGEFNVPFGKYKTINYAKNFSAYREAFKNWDFYAGDFQGMAILPVDSFFMYVDPPYDTEFTKYSKEDFKWEDQVRLANWLAQQKCAVVASNQATTRILSIYEGLGFKIELLVAPRRISCTGDRTPAKEMLATRNL